MKRNRRLLTTAIAMLVIGIGGQFAVRAMAQQNPMGMMGGRSCMMGNRMPQGINPGQLPDPDSEGARLLGQYCSQCHGVPGPGMHTASEWPTVVARMNRRMQMMRGGRMMIRIEAPDDNELGILRAYLEKNGQRAVDMSKLVGADTPGGLTFQKTCAQCHALPDPAQHTRNEWPAVIERMRTNMTAMGNQLPDQAATEGILSFLLAHAVK
ncbi:MAG TPA: hypothetical protein ENI97_13045 [Gammaproteobacteria bacterium]|nr:hypothetical protein [Gammaproteobacteria bacterium]